MTDDRSQERPVFIAPQAIEAGITPDHKVMVRLGRPPAEWGFDQNLVLALQLSPTESRAIARLLQEKADEAEAGLPRA